VYSLYATVTCSTPSPSPFPLHAKVSERSTRCLTTEAQRTRIFYLFIFPLQLLPPAMCRGGWIYTAGH
jgi:hypothetical protein